MVLPEQPQKLYDLQLVNELARGKEEFISSLARIFIDTVPPTSKEMVEACHQGNWEHVSKLAHKLKSTIDTMCINSIKADIRTIEVNGKHKTGTEMLPDLVRKVDAIILQVVQQLEKEFQVKTFK